MVERDEILVRDLIRGDREAQHRLYTLHAGRLLSIAKRYLGDLSESEDLLHDVFIKIFSSIGKFNYRGEGSLKAWMDRVVVNASIERLRQRQRLKLQSLDDLSPASESKISQSEDLVMAVPQEVLLDMVSELPEGYRTVFNLYCVEEYSHREIAEMLGINEKSSSSQLLRAKRLLATKLKSYIQIYE